MERVPCSVISPHTSLRPQHHSEGFPFAKTTQYNRAHFEDLLKQRASDSSVHHSHWECFRDCWVPPSVFLMLEVWGGAPDFAFPPGFQVMLTLLLWEADWKTTGLLMQSCLFCMSSLIKPEKKKSLSWAILFVSHEKSYSLCC